MQVESNQVVLNINTCEVQTNLLMNDDHVDFSSHHMLELVENNKPIKGNMRMKIPQVNARTRNTCYITNFED